MRGSMSGRAGLCGFDCGSVVECGKFCSSCSSARGLASLVFLPSDAGNGAGFAALWPKVGYLCVWKSGVWQALDVVRWERLV